jgi:nucleotide-binding universal stress UspA family protein
MIVLAALDLRAGTEATAEVAVQLATRVNGKLVFLHVAPPDPAFVGFEAGPQSTRDANAHTLRGDHSRIQEFAESARRNGLGCTALMAQGEEAATIVQQAERLGADYIVLGSRPRSLAARLILGNVANDVLKLSPLPVLIVPGGARNDKS